MNGPKRQLVGAALIGRRIGVAAFWCLAVFVVVASTRSVLLELYSKPQGVGDSVRCTSELRSLHTSLLDHASEELRERGPNGGEAAQTGRWLRAWDERFASTREPCAGMWEARETLQTLRKKLETMLRDYARDQRPLTERIERALSRHSPTSTRAVPPTARFTPPRES